MSTIKSVLQRVFAPRKTNVKVETKIINGKVIKEETQIYESPKKVKISGKNKN